MMFKSYYDEVLQPDTSLFNMWIRVSWFLDIGTYAKDIKNMRSHFHKSGMNLLLESTETIEQEN